MVLSLNAIEPVYNWQCLLDAKARILPPPVVMERSFLRHHLRWWLYSLSTAVTVYCEPDAGLCHHIPEHSRKVEDGRRDLPKSIVDTLMKYPGEIPWRAKRVCGVCLCLCLCHLTFLTQLQVTVTWISCYLADKLPDHTQPGWEEHQCSHLCLGAGRQLVCTVSRHLTWDSSKVNQERGTRMCNALCHCGCNRSLCEANKIHFPPCLCQDRCFLK